MANNRIEIMIVRQVIRLYTQRKKKYYISRNLGLSRNTVDKYIVGFISHELGWDEINRMSDKQLMKLFEAPAPPPLQRQIDLKEEFKKLEKFSTLTKYFSSSSNIKTFGFSKFLINKEIFLLIII